MIEPVAGPNQCQCHCTDWCRDCSMGKLFQLLPSFLFYDTIFIHTYSLFIQLSLVIGPLSVYFLLLPPKLIVDFITIIQF